MLLAIVAASLLTACSGSNVVVEPVSLKPVPSALMKSPGMPRCNLPKRSDYDPQELIAYSECWTAAYHALAERHIGLQRAVKAREQVASKAVKAAKGS